MFNHAMDKCDATVLDTVGGLLKRMSRRGGASRSAVAGILIRARRPLFASGQPQECVMAFAADFLAAHPALYERLVPALFDRMVFTMDLGYANEADVSRVKLLLAKWFRRFALLCLQPCSSLGCARFMAFYHAVSSTHVECCGQRYNGRLTVLATTLLEVDSCLDEFVKLIVQVPPATQVQIMEELVSSALPPERLCKYLLPDLLKNMAPEAKRIFTAHFAKHALESPDPFSKAMTAPMVAHFDPSSRLALARRAASFSADTRDTLLAAFRLSEDGVDGF